jgi:exopolysaccharide production protein ExoQ
MTIPRNILRIIGDGYTVAVLLVSSGAFVSLFVNTKDAAQFSNGSPVLKVFWGLVYLVTLVRILRHWPEAAWLIFKNKLLLILLLLVLVSALWSIAPGVTLHQGLSLVLSAMVAMDLSLRYSIERQLRLLLVTVLLAISLSVLVEVAFPGFVPGREVEGSAWHGIFGWKNDFGRMICLAIIVCLSSVRNSTLMRLCIVACGVALTILSRSVSAAGYALLMVGAFYFWPVLKWRHAARRFTIAAVVSLILIAAFAVSQNLSRTTEMVGKDPSMTGRVGLWRMAIADIGSKPILGYGYAAFWNIDSQPARRIREETNWDDAPHAHNGYIDLALAIGLAGLIVYLRLCWAIVRLACTFYLSASEPYRRWPLTCLVFMFVYQLTESSIVTGNALGWLLICGLSFSLTALAVPRPALVRQAARDLQAFA